MMSTDRRSLLLDEIKAYRPSKLRSVHEKITPMRGSDRQQSERKSSVGFSKSSVADVLPERRRWFAPDYRPDQQVSVILPGLLLGAQDVAKDLAHLRKLGVSHILNVATGVPNCFPADFTYKRMNIRDHPDMDIRSHFDECFKFIDEGRRQGWVFVHCNLGISRSATICIAYLMNRQRFRMNESITKVKDARPIVYPNVGFLRQLAQYEEELFGVG